MLKLPAQLTLSQTLTSNRYTHIDVKFTCMKNQVFFRGLLCVYGRPIYVCMYINPNRKNVCLLIFTRSSHPIRLFNTIMFDPL